MVVRVVAPVHVLRARNLQTAVKGRGLEVVVRQARRREGLLRCFQERSGSPIKGGRAGPIPTAVAAGHVVKAGPRITVEEQWPMAASNAALQVYTTTVMDAGPACLGQVVQDAAGRSREAG